MDSIKFENIRLQFLVNNYLKNAPVAEATGASYSHISLRRHTV